jgi:hypothetical protein
MFISGILDNCHKHSYKIWIITNQGNKIDQMFGRSDVKTINLRNNPCDVPTNMPNIKNKLYNLCGLDFEFIYLDCDMYVSDDLYFLWSRRYDKPFISTIHQKNIQGIVHKNHTRENINFMNSGLQVVSDPSFLNYDKLYELAIKMNFKFPTPGTDQALLDLYCKKLGYDFIHSDIGCEWNSCAGYGLVEINEEYDFNIIYKNKDIEYPVKINHYWNEFKPWIINCPIFKFYEGLV